MKILRLFICLICGYLFSIQMSYAVDGRVEVGTLTCEVQGTSGFIFGSTKDLTCLYDPLGTENKERYKGSISEYGLDLGVTGKTVIVWAVLAPSSGLPKGALNGTYAGVSAKASVGAGVGVNLLVGGSDDTIAFQPLSLQAQTGLNIALSVGRLKLASVGEQAKLPDEQGATGSLGEAQNDGTPGQSANYLLCGTQIRFAPGDTVYNIAARCGTTIDAILEANPKINNINEITVGSVLNVPSYPLPDSGGKCGLNYISEQGETLLAIAKKCHVSVGALLNENPGVMPAEAFDAGRKIRIPPYTTPLGRRSCGNTVVLGGPGTEFATLSDVARNCGITIDALLLANPEIKNVKNIAKNTKVNIPAIPKPVAQNKCGSHEIAKEGDTIFSIAVRCNTSPGAVIDLNEELGGFSTIPVGQAVRIPRSTMPVRQ